jgi:hypothetical protein
VRARDNDRRIASGNEKYKSGGGPETTGASQVRIKFLKKENELDVEKGK